MKKRITALALALALCAGLGVPALAAPEAMSIDSAEQLLAFGQAIQQTPELDAVLTADIDLSGIEWKKPLGYGFIYNGKLDGAGHTISGLKGSGALLNNLGEQGRIQNLNLVNIDLQDGDEHNIGPRSGGLVLFNRGEITGCLVSGKISSNSCYVGGIAGSMEGGAIINCQSNVQISYRSTPTVTLGSGHCGAGGIVGEFSSVNEKPVALLDRCRFGGSIQVEGKVPSCGLNVGGIAASSGIYGLIINCGNTGAITADVELYKDPSTVAYIGGITADSTHTAVENCWNTGSITVRSSGLPLGCNGIDGGWSYTGGTHVAGSNCWSTGSVQGQSDVSDPGQQGNQDCYFLDGTNLNAGNSPTFTRAQLTDGTLVNKLNAYVAKQGDLPAMRQLCQTYGMPMRDCRLLAWKQGPNGPELTESALPQTPSQPAVTPKPKPTGSAQPAAGFADVKADAWYAEAVQWAVKQGITTGTSDTTFSPDETCTVAQILTFLWRAKGSPAAQDKTGFDNVTGNEWYGQAALWAGQNSLVSGSSFEGEQPCTRAMVVTYLWKLAGSPAPTQQAQFADVPAGASYAQAVAWAVEHGITSGTGTTTFSPNDTCTRGQIVTFLHRAAQQGLL